jgi:hypothetical protein
VALLQGVPQLALAVLVEGDAEADDLEHVGLRAGAAAGGAWGCSAGAAAEADRLQWASTIASTPASGTPSQVVHFCIAFPSGSLKTASSAWVR